MRSGISLNFTGVNVDYRYKINWTVEYPVGVLTPRTARVEVVLTEGQFAGLRCGPDAAVLDPILHAQARALLGCTDVEYWVDVGQPHRIYRAPATAHVGWTSVAVTQLDGLRQPDHPGDGR